MKQIQATRGSSTPYTLPALVLIATVALALGFVVLLVGARVGVQFGEMLLHPNPFAAYAMLWPGQPVSNWMLYQQRLPPNACRQLPPLSGPRTVPNASDITQLEQCSTLPEERLFRTVKVMTENERIHRLVLFSESLSENALLLYWGAPDAIDMSVGAQQRVLRWERSTYTATAYVTSDSAIVDVVTLVAKP